MPDTKISALTAAATASLTDEVAVNSTLTSRKLTLQKIRDLFASLFATQAYADAAAAVAVAAVPIPLTHSTSEQVWPFEKGISGETIYVRTWDLGDGDLTVGVEVMPLTGLALSDLDAVSNLRLSYHDPSGSPATKAISASVPVRLNTDPPSVSVSKLHTNRKYTVWYTKQ